MSDIRSMQLGQVVDFVIAYNERQEAAQKAHSEQADKPRKRQATQADINSFFG